MRPVLVLGLHILLWNWQVSEASTNVFQGDCADNNVICEQLCIALTPVAYECSCWEGHTLQDDGLSCKVDTKVQYQEERVKTTPKRRVETTTKRYRPLDLNRPLAFKGNNYVEFPIDENAYLETNITIQFKLEEQKDGILFFAGQLDGDDFISITLDGPNVITRHDCGEGTIEDMYHGTFRIGQWHEINVWRKNCDRTQMSVDNGKKLVDNTDEFKNYKGITMDEGVFIGGAPNNIEFLQEKTGATDGFRGCIRFVSLNGDVVLDSRNSINKVLDSSAVVYCDAIGAEDRGNSSEIAMYDLTQRGIPEITPELFEQLTTTTSRYEKTLEIPILIEEIPTTAKMNGAQGISDQQPQTIFKNAHFNGLSNVSVPAPNSILSYLELSIQFKTEKQQGILFFWHENSKYLAVTIEKSFVKVYASLGADTAILRSENAISFYHWHKLEVWRSGKGILLKINKQNWVETELYGQINDAFENNGIIHIGSFDGETPNILQDVPGFLGCIKRIRMNGKTVQLSANSAQGVTECLSDPCASFGCPNKCVSHNSQPICSCQWPRNGEKCALTSESDVSAMSFNGFSYLELDDESVMSHVTGSDLDIAINLKLHKFSSNLKQVVLYAGDVNQEDDFFELSIDQNRFARFAINLGSGTVVLTHPKRIEDERWTTIEMIQNRREIKLSVNGEDPITAHSPEGAEQLNVYRNVFVGNTYLNDAPTNDGKDSIGLHGCVILIRFNQTTISHPKQAKSAINIEDCAI